MIRIDVVCVLIAAVCSARAQVLVRDLNNNPGPGPGTTLGSNPQGFVSTATAAYFTADDGANGRRIWWTDGIQAVDVSGPADPHPPFSNGHSVYLNAESGSGRALYVLGPGSSYSMPAGIANPGNFGARSNGDVFCTGFEPATGNELWSLSGGPFMQADIEPGPGSSGARLVGTAGSAVIAAATTVATGLELWAVFVGGGFFQLTDSPFASASVSYPVHAVSNGGHMFFAGYDVAHGQELWVTDGTSGGTRMVHDIFPGTASSVPQWFVMYQGRCYFVATSAGNTREIWSATAQPGSAVRLGSFGANDVRNLTPAGQLLFFTARIGNSGFELYRTDGTPAGTTIVRDILPGAGSGVNGGLTALGVSSRVVFRGQDVQGGMEPWISDGTTIGTVRLTDLVPGAGSSHPDGFCIVNDRLVFAADDGVHGAEPFAMPLSQAGAAVVERMLPGCPGTGGLVPVLAAAGLPIVGNSAFALDLTAARPSSLALFLTSLASARTPLGGGCTLQVGMPAATFSAATSPLGEASMPLPIGPTLLGVQIFSQVGVLDPNGAYAGVASTSNGLHVVVGLN